MSKSIEEVTKIIERKILFLILQELPNPDCPLKKQQNQWKIQEVKKNLSKKLLSDE
jgi:hypothetical protein